MRVSEPWDVIVVVVVGGGGVVYFFLTSTYRQLIARI